MTLSEEDILNYLGNLDVSKSSGPDGIPARLLKECSEQITPSLCKLFNLSLNTGCVPSEWKSAHVTPIHKKDSKEPVMNYRPISLLPIFSSLGTVCLCKILRPRSSPHQPSSAWLSSQPILCHPAPYCSP